MEVKAAVTREKGGEFLLEQVTLDQPGDGEVLIRIVACGICQTDIGVRNQHKPTPLPAVLGHEGAGIVESIGPGVKGVQPGDHVILSYTSCGHCSNCRTGKTYACHNSFQMNFMGTMHDGTHRLHQHGTPISTFFGQSSFATYATVYERNITKVGKETPLKFLAPLGCGIMTGAGAVLNKLRPQIGSTLAVFGCGTVGLSAIMAAKIAGCTTIIGVDVHESRLELAKELGATHTLNSKQANTVAEIRELTDGGLDYSIDTTANPLVLRQAVDALHVSGTTAMIGGPPMGLEATFDLNTLLRDRTLTGVLFGSAVPQVFVPKLIELNKSGQFPYEKLLTFYGFDELNEAVQDIEQGRTIKPVLVMEEQ